MGIFLPVAAFLSKLLIVPARLLFNAESITYDSSIEKLKVQFLKLDIFFIVSVGLAISLGFSAPQWQQNHSAGLAVRIFAFTMIAIAYAAPYVLGALTPPLSKQFDRAVLALKRVVVVGLQIYIQIILWFGVIYVSHPYAILDRGEFGATYDTAVYFSMITALTIGYGDVTPNGPFRLAAMTEGIACVALLTLLLTFTYSGLASLRTAYDADDQDG